MEVTTAKVIAMLTLGFGSFLSGMLPASFSEATRSRHPLLLSCLLCFGGGVLLATSVIHMLPEAREQLPENTELLFCIGFLLVYLVDEIGHLFIGNQAAQGDQTDQDQGNRVTYGSGEQTRLLRSQDGELQERCVQQAGSSQMCHTGQTEPCNRSSSGIVGLLCALFIHSVLEGVAIGLQTKGSEVLLLLGAVSAHKYVVGFCLGAETCEEFPARLCIHIVIVTIFSAGSVVGIGVGAGLDNISALKDSTAVPIMQALAAGTLLYVTVSEVLPRERASWHKRQRGAGAAQFVAVCVGFTLMYLTTKYLDYDG